MNYFVCIESTSYHLWQTELLIQSFKRLGLQEKLYIAICKTEEPVNLQFTHNIARHNKRFYFNNLHSIENKFYTLAQLLNEGILKPPFTTIHSDMILVNPIKAPATDLILGQFDEDQEFKNKIKPQLSQLMKKDMFVILDPSAIYVANDTLDKKFFFELWKLAERYKFKERWAEKAIWYLGIIQHLNFVDEKLSINNSFYEQSMLTYEPTQNFIHYNHGLPPSFHKYHFQFKSPHYFCIDDINPFKVMHSTNPNNTTNFIAKLIESYWKDIGFSYHNNVWEE